MLGLGVAGAVSPYLSTTLTGLDPRLPFIIASATLALASFALAKVERSLAKQAVPNSAAPQIASRKVSAPIVIFALASIVLAIGFQLHFFFNSAPVFKKFAGDLNALMPIFWIGFSIGMFPASLITKRFGGMPVMGLAGIVGAAAILVMQFAGTLELAVAAQLVAGAASGKHPDEDAFATGDWLYRRRRQNHGFAILRPRHCDVRTYGRDGYGYTE